MKKLSLMLVFVMLFVMLFALSAFAASFTYGPERLITDADVALKFDDAGNPVLNEDGSQKKMYTLSEGTKAIGGANWGTGYFSSKPEHVLDGEYSTEWCCSSWGKLTITFKNEWEISDVDGIFASNGKTINFYAYAADGTLIASYNAQDLAANAGGGNVYGDPSSNTPNFDMGTSFANLKYDGTDSSNPNGFGVKYIVLEHGPNWCSMSPRTYELHIKGRERIPSVGCTEHVWTEEYDPAPTCTEVGTLYRWCKVCLSEDAPKEVPALGHLIGSDPETYKITKDPDCQQVGEITFTCQRKDCGEVVVRDLTLDDVTDYARPADIVQDGGGGQSSRDNTYVMFDNNDGTIYQAGGKTGHYVQGEVILDMSYYISSVTVWTGYAFADQTAGEFNMTVYYKAPGETEWTIAAEAQVAPTDLNAWARTMHIVEFPEVQAEAVKIYIGTMDDYSGFVSEIKVKGSVVANAGGDHIWGEPNVVPPSCDHTGYTETICTVCKESKITDPVPAIEHDWSIVPTCTTGTTCSVCGRDQGDKLGHTEVDIPAVEATCTEAGKTAGKECTVCHEITVEPEEIEIDPNNHVNAEMNSAYTVSSCPDCGDVSFYNSHMGIDNDYTFYFMGNLVNIYKEGMDEFYAYTKVIDAETGVATLVLSEAFDEETEASRGTTFVGFVASVSVNKDDSLYISLAKDDVTYLFGTDPETIVDNSSALNGTYQYVENDVVIFEFVLEDGKITWTIAGGEENGAEATYTFYGSKFTTAFPLEYVSGWMGDFLLYSRYNPMTGETEEYPLTLKSDEEPEDPEIPEVNYGIEIDPITVVTTDTYNFIDNYTYTALTSGKYTFYFPAGLGLMLPGSYMPVIDFYDNENGQYYTVALAEGQTFEFVVGATVKDTWTISVYYEYAEVEAPEESDGDELVIGKTDINGEDATYIFTATENGVLTLTTQAAIMGEVTIVYSVNGGEAQSVALSSSVAINLVAGDEVVITVTAAGYSAFTAAWEKTIPVKDLIVNESSNQVEMSDVIFVYTAPEAGKLTLTTGAAIMGEVVFTYTINGSEALEFALQSTVELPLEAGDYVRVTVIAAGYSSLTATWEADHTHSYSETVTDPTCTDKGYTTYTCTCGDTYVGNYVDATGHKYTETKVESTCTVAGKITYTCACGDSYEETLKLAPHTEVKIPAVLPTPSVTGYTAGVKCSECDATLVAPKAINVTEMADLRDPTFRVASAALTLQENIAMKYRTIITEGFNAETAYMVFVFNNVEYTVTAHDYEESSGRYVFVFAETFPQYMNDNIAAYLYAETAEGEYSMNKILEYSVKTFCINQLKKNNAALTTVISDVLEYGAKTQLFMGYQTDALVTDLVKAEGYTLTPTAFPADGIPSDVNVQALTGDRTQGYDWKSGSLQMGSSTNIVLNFAANDLEGLVVKAEIEGQEPVYYTADKFVAQGGVNYTLYVNHLRAYEYNEKVTFTFEKNGTQIGSTLTYSINTFLYRNYKNTSKYNETARNLMKVIYTYGVSVANYWS